MERPLWQIFLTLFVVAFAAHRGAAASVLFLGGAEAPALLAGYAFQTAAGLALAISLWLGRAWACGALVALGVGVAATAILEVVAGVRPAVAAVTQVLVAALSTAALFLVLRRELGSA